MPNTVKQTKLCPNCNNEILAEAIKCKHCKSFIEQSLEKASNISESNVGIEIHNTPVRHSFDLINNNAYRVLGLPADASQESIHEANSSIRRVLKIGVSKSSPWDLAWIGPINRSEKDLQSAIGRLMNPVQRLQERLFWFSSNTPLLNEATIESLSSVISELETKANSHDLAVVKLAYANLIDPELKNIKLWIEAITLWETVISSDDYWASLLDMEMDGEFEPFATIEEVENLKLNVYRLVCSKLLALANEGIVAKNEGICRQVFSILKDSKIPRNIFYEFETQAFGSLEDQLTELCEQIRNDSNSILNKQDTNAPDNIKACTTALNRFNNEVRPLLSKLLNVAGQNTELANRVKEEAAGCLRGIAINFTWADEFIRSKELLEQAITIAPKDSSVYHRLLEDSGDVEKTSEKQKIWKDLKPIKSAPVLQTINACGFTLYGCTNVDPETQSGLSTYYFVILGIPIFPICRYRVISTGDRSYRFLGKAPLRKGDKWHLGISLCLILIAFLWISASSSTSSSNYSSNYSSAPSETTNYSSTPSETYTDPESTSTSTNEPATQEIQTPPEGIIPTNQFSSTYKIDLKAKIDAGRAKLASLEASYNQLADEVQSMKLELNQKQAEVEKLETQAKYGIDVEQYESKRQAYNQFVEKHNQTLSRAKKAEQEYNAVLEEDHRMVQEYNSL